MVNAGGKCSPVSACAGTETGKSKQGSNMAPPTAPAPSGPRNGRRAGRILRRVLLFLVAAACLAALALAARTARTDRDWAEEVSRQPTARTMVDGTVALNDVREWDYDENGPIQRIWRNRTYDPRQLTALWFNLDPFPAWDGVAHTFLTFEFGPDAPQRYLGVSVEARKQRGQAYSGLKGLFRQYELLHVWASESDLVKRRGLYLGESVYQYRLDLTDAQIQAVFRAFVEQTQDLSRQPRFYNTLLGNCTSELARTIRRTGGEIPWHFSYYLTGYADRYLHRLGYIAPAAADFTEIRQEARMNSRILAHAATSGDVFSDAIRRLR